MKIPPIIHGAKLFYASNKQTNKQTNIKVHFLTFVKKNLKKFI
jgi:hypothetical protein